MKTSELNNYILHYLKKDKTHTAIMLTGEWGSGKTYYIEKELVPFLKENDAISIVVSLYGLNDISKISKSIYMEMRMSILTGKQSETITTGRLIAKTIIKNITGLSGINLGLEDEDLEKLYKSVDLKDKLLILEDVERSNINIAILLGYVNELVERDGTKVLLVANENEIIRDKEFGYNKKSLKKENDNVEIPLKDVKQYLRIKEKTISDTIQFSGDIDQAVNHIIEEFENSKLNKIFKHNQELNEIVSNIVINRCFKNLRTLIFAIQKTIDIIDEFDCDNYEDDFFECLLLGNIYFSSNIKVAEFPEWDGDDYLSVNLGSNDMPLMRFAYDYIRWQNFDKKSVHKVYKAYKDFRFFDRAAEYKDQDLRVLSNYSIQKEGDVLSALKNIEKKLHIRDQIGIHAYCKLAYYMIDVGSQLGFDYKESFELMIQNVKGIGRKDNLDADIYFAHTFSFANEEIKNEYECFLNRFSKSISFEDPQQIFSYAPQDIENLYNNVCRNTYAYLNEHRFLSKYNLDNIIEMLLKSTSKQLNDFRGVLFAIYRHVGKGEFDKRDIEAMMQLQEKLQEKIQENDSCENTWDKIQLMQINFLRSNLEQFINQMSGANQEK